MSGQHLPPEPCNPPTSAPPKPADSRSAVVRPGMSGHANTCQCHNANPPWACTCGDDLRQARVENQQLRDALSEVITLCERHGAVRTAVVAARAALAGTPSEDT